MFENVIFVPPKLVEIGIENYKLPKALLNDFKGAIYTLIVDVKDKSYGFLD